MKDFSERLMSLEELLKHSARRMTCNTEDAKDLLQDTYMKALMYHEKFDENTNLEAWTYTIMKNTFINQCIKKSRQNYIFSNAPVNELHIIKPDNILQEKELDHAIECLDDKFKEPLRMHVQGYKYEEIASILGTKIGTVKSRIHFARKKLARILSEVG